jgi:hypothetical protein
MNDPLLPGGAGRAARDDAKQKLRYAAVVGSPRSTLHAPPLAAKLAGPYVPC